MFVILPYIYTSENYFGFVLGTVFWCVPFGRVRLISCTVMINAISF